MIEMVVEIKMSIIMRATRGMQKRVYLEPVAVPLVGCMMTNGNV